MAIRIVQESKPDDRFAEQLGIWGITLGRYFVEVFESVEMLVREEHHRVAFAATRVGIDCALRLRYYIEEAKPKWEAARLKPRLLNNKLRSSAAYKDWANCWNRVVTIFEAHARFEDLTAEEQAQVQVWLSNNRKVHRRDSDVFINMIYSDPHHQDVIKAEYDFMNCFVHADQGIIPDMYDIERNELRDSRFSDERIIVPILTYSYHIMRSLGMIHGWTYAAPVLMNRHESVFPE